MRRVEDSNGAEMVPSTTLYNTIPRDTWLTLEVAADQTLEEVRATLTGDSPVTLPFTGTSNGTFPSVRSLNLMSSSAGGFLAANGFEVARIETYFTTNGSETQHVAISGDAATVNAHPWRQGDPAV